MKRNDPNVEIGTIINLNSEFYPEWQGKVARVIDNSDVGILVADDNNNKMLTVIHKLYPYKSLDMGRDQEVSRVVAERKLEDLELTYFTY